MQKKFTKYRIRFRFIYGKLLQMWLKNKLKQEKSKYYLLKK